MNITRVNINSLQGAGYNPRVELLPGMPEYEKLKASILEFGYVEPIIVNDRTGIIVGGHQRLSVLKDLGYTDVEVVHVDLDEGHEKALNIALNKVSGSWDDTKLAELLEDIKLNEDIDIELTGFDLDELDLILNTDNLDNNTSGKGKGHKDKVEVTEEDEDLDGYSDIDFNIEINNGDAFRLGKHVLVCGDSYDVNTFNKIKSYIKADGLELEVVFTDPPYNISTVGGEEIHRDMSIKCRKGITELGINNIDISKLEYLFKCDIPSIYICSCCRDTYDYITLANKYGYMFNIHVYAKNNPVPFHTKNYLNDMEYVLYFSKPGRTFNNDLDFDYYRGFYLGGVGEGLRESEGSSHPTVKPVALVVPKLAISCSNGAVVDMFAGSGTTLVAANKLGKASYNVELTPKYCLEIMKRYIKLTGDYDIVKLDNIE